MAKYDGFNNWQDVANEFTGTYDFHEPERQAQALKNIPEPDEVLIAVYSHESYEGDAWVVYRQGDKYYTVEGGHCSCYGLENQWSPEEYETPELLLAALNKGDWSHDYGAKKGYVPLLKHILEERVNRARDTSTND